MRIAIDSRTLLIPRLKGIGRHISHLLNNMSTLDPSMEFVLYGEKEQFIHEQFLTRLLPTKGYRFRLWENLYLPIDMLRQRCDLLHSPANTCPLYSPCPIVLTIHDLNLIKDPSRKNSEHARYFAKRLAKSVAKARAIITVSLSSQNDILNMFPKLSKDKVHVIYNGLDVNAFPEFSSQEVQVILPNLDLKKKYILLIGAVEAFKGTEFGLDAYAKIANKIDHDLIITSLPEEIRNKYAQKIKKHNLCDRVHLFDFVSDKQLAALYRTCEIFLFCSQFEGFGLPLLEAMYCGCKVVATDIPTTKEIAGEFAALSPFDNDRFAQQILETVSKSCDNKKQRQHCLSFSWRETAKQTLEVYQQIGK